MLPEGAKPHVGPQGQKQKYPWLNDRAGDEIHESARNTIKGGNHTDDQVKRWREDLGDAPVDKLLKEFA